MVVLTNAVGVVLYLFVGLFRVEFTWFSFAWALAMAVIMIPYYMIGIKVLSLGSLAIYSMFMMLGGMLVPFFYGILFLNEEVTLCKILGSILLTLFIIFQAFSQQPSNAKDTETVQAGTQRKTKWLFFILCLVIFFLNGMTGVIAKAHQIGSNPINEVSFTIISCAISALMGLVWLTFHMMTGDKKVKFSELNAALKWKPFFAMVLMGAAAYTGNFLHLKAANKVPASVQFPLVSGGVIVLSSLVSAFIFREKLSKKEWISVLGAFIATVLFAF